jgi:hypothetical protein
LSPAFPPKHQALSRSLHGLFSPLGVTLSPYPVASLFYTLSLGFCAASSKKPHSSPHSFSRLFFLLQYKSHLAMVHPMSGSFLVWPRHSVMGLQRPAALPVWCGLDPQLPAQGPGSTEPQPVSWIDGTLGSSSHPSSNILPVPKASSKMP